jgi:hypothetical protein
MKRYRDAGVEQVVLLLFDAPTTATVAPALERLAERLIEPARWL